MLAIPNVATDTANIPRNSAKLVEMLHARGFTTQLLPTIEGRGPVVFGKLDTPNAKRTIIFYMHYDGQPVDASTWHGTKPFVPTLRDAPFETGGKIIPVPADGKYKDEWRLYARSSGDDKSPIVALLAAMDALRAEQDSHRDECEGGARWRGRSGIAESREDPDGAPRFVGRRIW